MYTQDQARDAVIAAIQAICQRGYALGTSGNVSVRTHEDAFVITPSSRPYPITTREDLCLVRLDGSGAQGPYPPSIEMSLHRRVYELRPDVMAVVHTHSPYAVTAASLEGIATIPPVDIEAVLYLGGSIAVAPFAPPGSAPLALNTGASLRDRAAVLLQNHGGVGVGRSIEDALSATDHLERLCQIYLTAVGRGRPRALPEEYLVEAMAQSRKQRGLY